MQIVSAYLLAASAVDSGNYDEDYDVDIDMDFAEYMDVGGEDLVGEYIELSTPTDENGGADFSGNQFCGKWLSAFIRPIEYCHIYTNKWGIAATYPSTDVGADWSGFVAWDTNPTYRGMFIPQALDQQCYQSCGKHINMWLAEFCQYDVYNPDNLQAVLWGFYKGSNVTFKCLANVPTQGYASFSHSDYIGSDIGFGTMSWYSREWNSDGSGWVADHAGHEPAAHNYILVYNVTAFKKYLESMSKEEIKSYLLGHYFILAECNVSTKKA